MLCLVEDVYLAWTKLEGKMKVLSHKKKIVVEFVQTIINKWQVGYYFCSIFMDVSKGSICLCRIWLNVIDFYNSMPTLSAVAVAFDRMIYTSHCSLESHKCYLSQHIYQCSCFRTSIGQSPLISHIIGRFKLSTIKYFDVLLQLEWTHYFGSEHIQVHFIDLFKYYKKFLVSKTN